MLVFDQKQEKAATHVSSHIVQVRKKRGKDMLVKLQRKNNNPHYFTNNWAFILVF